MRNRRHRPGRKAARGALAGTLLALLAGCATPPAVPPPEAEPGSEEPYVIGPGDQLRITTWKTPELTESLVVRPDGKISFPLLDDVQASGLTTLELKEVITESLREYIANPDVTVIVSQIQSKRAFVTGDGVRSMAVNLNRETRVLDAIVLAGGFNNFADKNGVKILRRTPAGLIEYHFHYDRYVGGDAPESNLVLQDGDTVVVP